MRDETAGGTRRKTGCVWNANERTNMCFDDATDPENVLQTPFLQRKPSLFLSGFYWAFPCKKMIHFVVLSSSVRGASVFPWMKIVYV